VVGGPSAKWSRTFGSSVSDSVSIGLILFTDEFSPRIHAPTYNRPFRTIGYEEVLQSINDKDLVYRYFSDPPVNFNVKLIICQPIADNPNLTPATFPDKPDFITLSTISRNKGIASSAEQTEKIVSGIKSAFLEAFPYDESKQHNNIPAFLGLYVDNSRSLGTKALEPALSEFKDFYQKYSYDYGLKDINDVPHSGQIIEYIPEDNNGENWVVMAQTVFNDILDTGNIILRDQRKFIADSVGTFNGTNDTSFNVPPDSGGKVFIFEKESGSWNLIQEIKSPNITYDYPDRFGHAVSISDDANVIAIGSPYINEAVMVYERSPYAKDYLYGSVFNWTNTYRKQKYRDQLSEYIDSLESIDSRNKTLYLSLDQSDKFRIRLDLGVEEYQNIFRYTYNDAQPQGSWSFITDVAAPTQRLGYSIDLNEDGTKLVVGSPTDSMNFFDDADVYYNCQCSSNRGSFNTTYFGQGMTGPIKSAWPSTVNAGSVRIFESRNYYPHSKAVEYGKFGNLHQKGSDITADSGHFNHLSNIFYYKNFTKIAFDDPDIPQEAGLVFIITPEFDALSNEVFDKISQWLALGDRNLVLVGNDPTWEGGGKYFQSNRIINNILERLNSRMRITQARYIYESLPSGSMSFDNIVPSFVPMGCTSTYINRTSVRGSGVGDIRIYFPGYFDQMRCAPVPNCSAEREKVQIQSKYEMPLQHYGDLRAQWNDLCCSERGEPLIYGRNWPLVFGSYTPACFDEEFEELPTKNYEPIPIMVAAEQVKVKIEYPTIPARYITETIYEKAQINDYYTNFGSSVSDPVFDFIWDSGNSDYSLLDLNAAQISNMDAKFYKPDDFEEKGYVLQAKAVSRLEIKPYLSDEAVSDKGYHCVEEKFKDTNSKIILIASVDIESKRALYDSGSNDNNINFYTNLVSTDPTKEGGSKIAQLGGWTNRTSFIDGYESSILLSILNNYNDVFENHLGGLDRSFNVAWIANTEEDIPLINLQTLEAWLREGNKKLIITYNQESSKIKATEKLLEKLGATMKPLYLKYLDQYANVSTSSLTLNPDSYAAGAFNGNIIEQFNANTFFVPIELGPSSIPLMYNDQIVTDRFPRDNINDFWEMRAGITKVSFPVIAGSGYELHFSTAQLTPMERIGLDILIENVTIIPYDINSTDPPYTFKSSIGTINDIGEPENWKETDGISMRLYPDDIQKVKVQVLSGSSGINIYIGSNTRQTKGYDKTPVTEPRPKTCRLLGISGVMIPVFRDMATWEYDIPVGVRSVKIEDEVEGYTIETDVTRTISTDNTKYCNTNDKFCISEGLCGQLIEDGPVVVAQELEMWSRFDAGIARSRITLIADSSMVQGRYMTVDGDPNSAIYPETLKFIRSLYPETYFDNSLLAGRQYNVQTKLISPERGSPAKYFLKSGTNNSLISSFTNLSNNTVLSYDKMNPSESAYIPKYIKRPKLPWEEETDAEKIAELKKQYIDGFFTKANVNYGMYPRFSGVVDSTLYLDATVAGGIPKLMKEKGYDYMDLDKIPMGYPGDLFGYSVAIQKDKILIGSPFSAFSNESFTPWSSQSNLTLAQDGGAGCVYMFEKTGKGIAPDGSITNWQCLRKFKPESLMGGSSGINTRSDQFGSSLDIQGDIIAIGSPAHDYGSKNILDYKQFGRKYFNASFNITNRNVIDLGVSGNRLSHDPNNTSYKLNAGAIYTYENGVVDWSNRIRGWKFVEKITSSNRDQNERYGASVYVTRPIRSDADYSIFNGCEKSENSGVVYIKDIMLRSNPPAERNPNSWINARVYGDKDKEVNLNFKNMGDADSAKYAFGEIYANYEGEIFLEVSGQDPSTKGFITHRPYIESVIGDYKYGVPYKAGMVLYSEAGNEPVSSNMPIFIDVEDSATVYNTLGLYSSAGFSSSQMKMYVSGVPGFISSSGLTLFTASGTKTFTETLNMRIRGK
jgi:hypothetical protein